MLVVRQLKLLFLCSLFPEVVVPPPAPWGFGVSAVILQVVVGLLQQVTSIWSLHQDYGAHVWIVLSSSR